MHYTGWLIPFWNPHLSCTNDSYNFPQISRILGVLFLPVVGVKGGLGEDEVFLGTLIFFAIQPIMTWLLSNLYIFFPGPSLSPHRYKFLKLRKQEKVPSSLLDTISLWRQKHKIVPLRPWSVVLRPAALASPESLLEVCRSRKCKKKKKMLDMYRSREKLNLWNKRICIWDSEENLSIVKSNYDHLKLNIEIREVVLH